MSGDGSGVEMPDNGQGDDGFRSLAAAGGASVVAFTSRARSLGLDEGDLSSESAGACATLVIRRTDCSGWLEMHRGGRGRILGPLRSADPVAAPLAPAPPAPVLPSPVPSRAASRAVAAGSVDPDAPIDVVLAQLDALEPFLRSPEGRARLRRVRDTLTGTRAGGPRSTLAG